MTDETEPAAAATKTSQMNRVLAVVLAPLALSLPFSLYFVVPAFKKMFEETGIALPALTELIVQTSNFLYDYWYLVVPPLVALLGTVVVLTFVSEQLRDSKDWRKVLVIGIACALLYWLVVILGLALPMAEVLSKL